MPFVRCYKQLNYNLKNVINIMVNASKSRLFPFGDAVHCDGITFHGNYHGLEFSTIHISRAFGQHVGYRGAEVR